jgi:hypothetical protein
MKRDCRKYWILRKLREFPAVLEMPITAIPRKNMRKTWQWVSQGSKKKFGESYFGDLLDDLFNA